MNNEEMGMTDKQFNGFIRLLLDSLKDAANETDPIKKAEQLQKIIENLQNTLED